ncbi:hypothetical protein ACFB49_42900 [Sphingomonas sp. DBB INV C78]|uniref:DUF5131 family protein n=1 Tax=Sphingomonas sp. DBB INV C78 TaxID=3349434 RepID=UPI0036D21CD0
MADHTKIEWTDATWNPVTGCSVVSPGCTNCYAMKLAGTRMKHHPSRQGLTIDTKAGPVWNGQVRLNREWLSQPIDWKRPRRIFVCAHGDLFHENVPTDWIDEVFAVMAIARHHTFQVLTKRPDRARDYLDDPFRLDNILDHWITHTGAPREPDAWPLPNVHLGTSIENRAALMDRAGELRQANAAKRFFSCEPLLGDLGHVILDGIDWVIVGGESGRGARPMHPDWARSLRDQCASAGVPYFFKQWGNWRAVYDRDVEDPDWRRCGDVMQRTPRGQWLNLAGGQGFHGERVVRIEPVHKKIAGRLLDGVEHNGAPA